MGIPEAHYEKKKAVNQRFTAFLLYSQLLLLRWGFCDGLLGYFHSTLSSGLHVLYS